MQKNFLAMGKILDKVLPSLQLTSVVLLPVHVAEKGNNHLEFADRHTPRKLELRRL